jgi:hypothetical protein
LFQLLIATKQPVEESVPHADPNRKARHPDQKYHCREGPSASTFNQDLALSRHHEIGRSIHSV